VIVRYARLPLLDVARWFAALLLYVPLWIPRCCLLPRCYPLRTVVVALLLNALLLLLRCCCYVVVVTLPLCYVAVVDVTVRSFGLRCCCLITFCLVVDVGWLQLLPLPTRPLPRLHTLPAHVPFVHTWLRLHIHCLCVGRWLRTLYMPHAFPGYVHVHTHTTHTVAFWLPYVVRCLHDFAIARYSFAFTVGYVGPRYCLRWLPRYDTHVLFYALDPGYILVAALYTVTLARLRALRLHVYGCLHVYVGLCRLHACPRLPRTHGLRCGFTFGLVGFGFAHTLDV